MYYTIRCLRYSWIQKRQPSIELSKNIINIHIKFLPKPQYNASLYLCKFREIQNSERLSLVKPLIIQKPLRNFN